MARYSGIIFFSFWFVFALNQAENLQRILTTNQVVNSGAGKIHFPGNSSKSVSRGRQRGMVGAGLGITVISGKSSLM